MIKCILFIVAMIAIVNIVIKFGIVIGLRLYNIHHDSDYILKIKHYCYTNETFGILPAIECYSYDKSICIVYHWLKWNYSINYEIYNDDIL